MSGNLPTGRNLPATRCEPAGLLQAIWGPLMLLITSLCMVGLVLTARYFPGILAFLLSH